MPTVSTFDINEDKSILIGAKKIDILAEENTGKEKNYFVLKIPHREKRKTEF